MTSRQDRARSWISSGRTRRSSLRTSPGVQELVAGKTDIDGLLNKLDEAYQQK